MTQMTVFSGITALATLALLVAEHRKSQTGKWIAKPLASAGFLGTALAGGALDSSYGRALLAAFALCFVGDVFLIPKSRKAFLVGLGSFLLGHVGFGVAIGVRGIDVAVSAVALVVLGAVTVPVLRWLLPHVDRKMRRPVLAYVAVITAMVALAAGGAARGAGLALGAAAAFYVSDLSVARDRFVAPGFLNRAWGLPLYYAAQVAFAWTLA